MSNDPVRPYNRLIVPGLGPLYGNLSEFAETLLRVVAGLALVTHGFPKILDPISRTGLVESLGIFPGPPELWAVLLAMTEFFGGILIAIGLLTRPAAFAGLFVLLVTVYFHWIVQSEGYGGSEKSILWAAILFYLVIRGANSHSVDARLGKTF
ncbi:DoxX family protein [Hyphomicrobium nitrativorans NL23]|uniref:DoxX family protein n=1 Tax=Hyphomicrobium nitrativorans NL23 TaxID=1029756 RepID=V5SBJ0_9HYPH|nr:DoxX family protein [Hyphomicrobium nitrativorans]AHB47400.1 DoxX family protein [Hyphomicrobium nitrativorans NL23]